jgi:hypothetical protein
MLEHLIGMLWESAVAAQVPVVQAMAVMAFNRTSKKGEEEAFLFQQ